MLRDLPPDLEAERQRIARRLDTNYRALDLETDETKLAELREQHRQLRRARDLLNARIRELSPRLAELGDRQSLDFNGIHQTLDPGTLMLSYSVGPKQTDLFLLTRDGELDVRHLEIIERELWQTVGRFRKTLVDPEMSASSSSLGRFLYITLIDDKAATRIADAERLLIIPDGPLHYLPFSALIRDDEESDRGWEYLVEWKPLHTAISATVYAETRGLRRDPPPEPGATVELAAFGNPKYPVYDEEDPISTAPEAARSAIERGIFDGGLMPLPGTEREVLTIGGLYDNAATFLQKDATEETAKTVGAKARILHFAAHGVSDDDDPLDSFIALTIPDDPGDGENGLLQAWEIIEDVSLDADLVVLSACQTAFGPERGGEGLISLSRAFHFAGARTVAATLWSVADASTADLMIRFYGYLNEGMTKDMALRQAQLDFIRGNETDNDYSAPYYWAAFQLFGDWQ